MRRAGALLLLLAGCEGALPPLRGELEPGKDAYVVFVGGTGQAGGDLYAVAARGGAAQPITYSGVGEMRPALSPDGAAVAFLRGASLRDTTPGTVWVMNLLSGAERQLELPKGSTPEAVGWSEGGRALVVRAGGGLFRFATPPAHGAGVAVTGAAKASAESALAVLLGEPAFARAVPCADPEDVCVVSDTAAPALLARGVRDPARWGADSVAYVAGNAILVRPLGPGRERRLEMTGAPRAPRQITVFTGSAPSSP
ncbi:MAG TPA: hypothetical protein VFT84_05110 [Gemmatimonadales bacterium]|nr:hypothetical protein [Gemmatimonadales bacterium]